MGQINRLILDTPQTVTVGNVNDFNGSNQQVDTLERSCLLREDCLRVLSFWSLISSDSDVSMNCTTLLFIVTRDNGEGCQSSLQTISETYPFKLHFQGTAK